MENLDLSTLSTEQREEIMAILNKKPESNKIREEYLENIKHVKKSEEYDSMDYETKTGFENMFSSNNIKERRLKGQLSHDDRVTYKQLEAIHKDGVANFWGKVKNVVESKQDVDISNISDRLDPETEKLLKGN